MLAPGQTSQTARGTAGGRGRASPANRGHRRTAAPRCPGPCRCPWPSAAELLVPWVLPVLLLVGRQDLVRPVRRLRQRRLRILDAQHRLVECFLPLEHRVLDPRDRWHEMQDVDLGGERRLFLQRLELCRLAHFVAGRHLTALGPLERLLADPVQKDPGSNALVLIRCLEGGEHELVRTGPGRRCATDVGQRRDTPLEGRLLLQSVNRPNAVPVEGGFAVLQGDEVGILGDLLRRVTVLDQIAKPGHGLHARILCPGDGGTVRGEQVAAKLPEQRLDRHRASEREGRGPVSLDSFALELVERRHVLLVVSVLPPPWEWTLAEEARPAPRDSSGGGASGYDGPTNAVPYGREGAGSSIGAVEGCRRTGRGLGEDRLQRGERLSAHPTSHPAE